MTTKKLLKSKLLIALTVLCMIPVIPTGLAYSRDSVAVAQQIEGEANAYTNGYKDTVKLDSGSQIQPPTMITTGAKSKALLRWQGGFFTSMGEFSSVSITGAQSGGSPQAQVVDGIVRFKTDTSAANRSDYAVTTPIASIRPDSVDQPVDYVVEVYEPSTTILTVLQGKVRVVDNTKESQGETTIDACRTVYLGQGKKTGTTGVGSDAVANLVDQTTIAGTLPTPDTCPSAVAEGAPPRESPRIVREYAPEYYIEPSYVDFYPFENWDVLPYYSDGGYWWDAPYIGSWYIPYPYWVSPAVVQIFVNKFLINKAISINKRYIRDLRADRLRLRQLIGVATQAGDPALAARAQRDLNVLDARRNWARQRLGGLESRLSNLNSAAERFGRQLPARSDLAGAIEASLGSPRNANVARRLENRLNEPISLGDRLTTLGQRQVDSLQSRLAGIRDPSQRMAARSQLAAMTQSLTQGRVPVTRQERQIGRLAQQLRTTRDPSRLERTQSQLSRRLANEVPGVQPQALSSNALSTLRNDLNRVPNAELRGRLTNRLAEIEQATRSRQRPTALFTQPSQTGGARGRGQQLERQRSLARSPEPRQQLQTQRERRLRATEERARQAESRRLRESELQAKGVPRTQEQRRELRRGLDTRSLQQPRQQQRRSLQIPRQQPQRQRVAPQRSQRRSFSAPRAPQPRSLQVPRQQLQRQRFTPQRSQRRSFSAPRAQRPRVNVQRPRMSAQPRVSAPRMGAPQARRGWHRSPAGGGAQRRR